MLTFRISSASLTVLRLILLFIFSHASLAMAGGAVGLYYGNGIALDEFRAFDIVVVEPEHGHDPTAYRTPHNELFAYVAVGEVQPFRSYYQAIPEPWKFAANAAWGSRVIDLAQPGWADFVAERIVAPLWQRGYRGLFLDTLDSYRLASQFDEQAQQDGLVRVIETLHRRFPGIRLILNRGFDIVPRVKDKIAMVAAESLFQGWDAGQQRYVAVPAADRDWLLGQLRTIRERDGLPVMAIDYVPPDNLELMRETARRIAREGIIPWVSDSQLEHLGIGAVEPLPRRILIAYDGREAPALNYTEAHRFLQMPINHLGYIAEFADANQPLPPQLDRTRYAGIVTWMSGQLPGASAQALAAWLIRQADAGLPILQLGQPGFVPNTAFARRFGLHFPAQAASGKLSLRNQHRLLGFELQPRAERSNFMPIQLTAPGESLIDVVDQRQQRYVGGALTEWGGFLFNPFLIAELPGTDSSMRWIANPFALLERGLKLPALPVPDITTENGRRLLLSHIDGDGFPSIAELPDRPYAGEALYREILQKYRLPTTVSVIESEVSPDGLHPKDSPQLEAIARRIFRLPHVEIASHSYSHPFLWNRQVRHGIFRDSEQEYYQLDLPGYQFNLQREIDGSVDYIRRRLAPPDKPVGVFLWTGDTAPGADALARVDQAGLLNLNGGDTSITRSNPTLTAVGANGIVKDGHLQVYAPITNENIYTNLWRGPFYGYEQVIDSFEMTGSPRRLKPVGIYYHTYSATKRAGLQALHKVYAWARTQPLHPVYASEYIQKVRDFYSLAIAREGDGWRIRSRGDVRTLRLPAGAALPDPAAAIGLAGYRMGEEGHYLHLTGAAAWLPLAARTPTRPYLSEANARLTDWQADPAGRELSFRLRGHVPLEFALARAENCRIRANGAPIAGKTSQTAGTLLHHFRLDHAAAQIQISCPAP